MLAVSESSDGPTKSACFSYACETRWWVPTSRIKVFLRIRLRDKILLTSVI